MIKMTCMQQGPDAFSNLFSGHESQLCCSGFLHLIVNGQLTKKPIKYIDIYAYIFIYLCVCIRIEKLENAIYQNIHIGSLMCRDWRRVESDYLYFKCCVFLTC